MNEIKIPYICARQYIKEGDVLLFRSTSLLGSIIAATGNGKYSHVGLASWVFDRFGNKLHLECVEFREFKGGRAINLSTYINDGNTIIDVYRPAAYMYSCNWDNKTNHLIENNSKFEGRKITTCLRNMTGLPYGWARIWYLAKFYLPFIRYIFRFLSKEHLDDDLKDVIYPICSTAVAYCFSKEFVDLTHHRSDHRMEPSDIARSPILNYLFTLTS